ncbi:hypothetical protein ACWCYY_38550 [Kitasatospora sp. NPDC001664]
MIRTLLLPFRTARLDRTYGRTELIAARDAIRRGDTSSVVHAMADFSDHNVRADIAYVAAEELVRLHGTEIPTSLQHSFENLADDANSWTLRGAHEVLRAWQIRGYARASQTDQAAFRGFRDTLQGAEQICYTAAGYAPEDPLPWVFLVHMARGQQIGPRRTLERFAELDRRSPAHLHGNEQMVLSLSPKWGTPFPVLQNAIEEQRSTAPAGSPVHLNIVQAYIELWFDSPASERLGVTAKYSIRNTIEKAVDGWLEHGNIEGQHALHNYCAFWYSLTGQHDRAKPHFEAAAGYIKAFPWSYHLFPVRSFQKSSRAARKA